MRCDGDGLIVQHSRLHQLMTSREDKTRTQEATPLMRQSEIMLGGMQ